MITQTGRPKKDPENVRRRLLNSTASLMTNRGFAGVSVSDIANDAGVTKGGLFHHFASKQELIAAVFEDELERFSKQIDKFFAAEPPAYGCFTRAYIRATLVTVTDKTPTAALTFSLCSEPELMLRWNNWLSRRLTQHHDTDAAPELEIARLAADGIWFTSLLAGRTLDNKENLFRLQQRLIASTMESSEKNNHSSEF
ncbi:TetR/AcrR family transcriptional regulator [Erwinia persicina]|uniref:TetR/AcrR family transcriptional regulator n=1 Tax=Erwinia persicina TaxID=55211 RepID=UPI000789236E|nr:TetR/AcrR family transcriptional regulator [Erwinia persicina]